jgi:hypothetical protein
MDDIRLIELLRRVRDIADANIADECPRDDSEPYITIWENANWGLKRLGGYEKGR